MDYTYKYETFSAESGDFDKNFTNFLNERASKNWRVKQCNYCHDSSGERMHAACMFERETS